MATSNRALYAGSYQLRARVVRAAAYADSRTRCWRCGLTLGEEQGRQPGRRVVWQAGHTRPEDVHAPLAAEHSTCNQGDGATRGNRKRGLNNSRRWL
jgi:hypothetical protein